MKWFSTRKKNQQQEVDNLFCSKIEKKDKNEIDKEKKKLKDEGKKESEEESNNLEKYIFQNESLKKEIKYQ